MGCPIRKFTDQSLFAAPHDLSQRTTSFIASQHQGIHRILLRHLITLIIDAPPTRQGWPRALCRTTRPEARPRTRTPSDARPVKTSLLQPHPRTRRSSAGPLTDAGTPTGSPRDRRRRRSSRIPAPPLARAPGCTSNVVSLHDVDRSRTIPAPPGHRTRAARNGAKLFFLYGRPRRSQRAAKPKQAANTDPPHRRPTPRDPHRAMVEPDGIEPTTSCLQSTRSTN